MPPPTSRRPSRARRAALFSLAALSVALSSPPARAQAVWIGLARGPLAPAPADALERDLVAALDRAEPLVDAGGRPLGPRGVTRETEAIAALRDAGVDAYLRFDYRAAFETLDAARARFEDRLGGLGPAALYQDVLLAAAEAAWQRGERGRARNLLERLAPLEPERPPSRSRHDAAFVAAWREVRAGLGPVGRLELSGVGAEPWLDGRPLEPPAPGAPILVTGLEPGRHLLALSFPGRLLTRELTIAPGATLSVQVDREDAFGPDRQAVLADTVLRPGTRVAAKGAAEVIAAAGGASGWISVVRPGQPPRLVLGRLAPSGLVAGAAALELEEARPLPETLDTLARRAAAEPDPGRAASLFELPTGSGAALPPATRATESAAPEESPLWTKWWVWAAAGIVLASAAAGAAALASGPPEGVVDVEVTYP